MSGKQLFLLVIVLLAAFLALDSVFVVDEREKVRVFQLGQIKRSDSEPGLHFKLPLVQNVRTFDSRVLTLDADAEEYLTLEKKNVKVDFYVKWRIADVAQYYRATSGLESNALSRLSSIINQGLRDEFGNRTIRQAVSGERNDIMRQMEANAAEKIAEFGIDLVDVRIKRIDLPDDVSDSVYNRMRSERQRVAADFRARGAEEAEKIRAAAERERQVLLAEAYSEAEEIKGEGDAEAADIYANVFGEDTEFYNFYRSLGVYREGFKDRSDVLVLEPGRAQDSAAAVFRTIYRYWKTLPEDSRPRLYLFGLSLGSHGSEASPPLHAWLGDSFDGAVWSGPPFRNRLWLTIQRDRDEGSPSWRPVFEGGANFRVIGHGGDASEAPADWGRVRMVYMVYPSDAIVFFEESMFYRQPEWLTPPRGEDVSPLLRWYPIITALQVGIDMMLSAEVPPGHGHDYAVGDYISAWNAVTAPENWTDEDARRLATTIETEAAKHSGSW